LLRARCDIDFVNLKINRSNFLEVLTVTRHTCVVLMITHISIFKNKLINPKEKAQIRSLLLTRTYRAGREASCVHSPAPPIR
jgi:hypothetical protein